MVMIMGGREARPFVCRAALGRWVGVAVVVFSLGPPAPSAAQAPVDASVARPERDHVAAIGVGLHGMRLRTSDGTRMGMAGPATSVSYFVGRRWGFMLRGQVAFPLHGRMHRDGEAQGYNLYRMYEGQRLALDGLFMVAYRLRVKPLLDLMVAGGIHLQTFRLVSTDYNPIEGILGGVGGLVRVERRLGARFFGALEVAVAVDPIDFVRHRNRILVSAPMTTSLAIGTHR